MRIAEIVIVHHATPELLGRTLARLADVAPDRPVRILDTGPDAGPAHRAAAAQHPSASVQEIDNHSYAAAVNRAVRSGPGAATLVMNADAIPEADTIPSLEAALADPDVALAGPLGRTPAGSLQDLGLPYRWWTRSVEGQGPRAVIDVPWLSAFMVAVRRDAARDVGGMDATLRFFNEDLDWCFRLRRAGWRCRLTGAEALHVVGAATPTAGRFWVEGLRGGLVVAERYRGPLRVAGQRAALALFAAARTRTAPPEQRPAWRAVFRMACSGRYHHSTFGATLDEAAPGFPEAWPPEDVA